MLLVHRTRLCRPTPCRVFVIDAALVRPLSSEPHFGGAERVDTRGQAQVEACTALTPWISLPDPARLEKAAKRCWPLPPLANVSHPRSRRGRMSSLNLSSIPSITPTASPRRSSVVSMARRWQCNILAEQPRRHRSGLRVPVRDGSTQMHHTRISRQCPARGARPTFWDLCK